MTEGTEEERFAISPFNVTRGMRKAAFLHHARTGASPEAGAWRMPVPPSGGNRL